MISFSKKSHGFFLLIFWSVIMCSSLAQAAPILESLDDADLSTISGQDGIATDIEFRLNTDGAGVPLTTGFSSCRNTALCNIAIQFNNRLNGGAAGSPDAGEWLVLKDVYGSLLIKDLWINGAFSQAAPSVYADDSRFWNSAGTTCLPNGGATAGCAGTVLNKPLLQLGFKSAEAVGANYTTFEPDIQLHLNIGRMAVQYGETGPSTDNGKSFMGVLVSDTTQLRAQIDIDGRVMMSGF